MKRINPIGSVLGFFLTILLFVGLGISLWFDRGLAFSPGQVTGKSQAGVIIDGYTSHADFEKSCGNCHQPLKTNLATSCLSCHTDIRQQVQNGQGAHSQIEKINQCSSCHPEHRGRNFDPTLASFQLFDHSKTSFSLIRHQENYDTTPMSCSACHAGPDFTGVSNQTCYRCHIKYDNNFSQAHTQDYGEDCLACHDGLDRMQNFDHSQSGFPLVASHAQVKCADCHQSNQIQATPRECSGCHPEPALHRGVFAQACEACHTAQSWSPAKVDNQPFGHLQTAGFSLERHQVDYSNQAITCATCHASDLQTFDLQVCIECHTARDPVFINDHMQQYGTNCLVCHDGVDRLSDFEHANFFPLDGSHASLACTDCHPSQQFRGTPTECSQCHPEPEIHAGTFGLKCYYCHSVEAWSPASLQQHGFPLNHGIQEQNPEQPCETCHGANYVEYTCYNCHDHQPAEIEQTHLAGSISKQDLPYCASCHPDGVLTADQQKP